MDHDLIVLVEKEIKKYFKNRWTKEDIAYFIGKSPYELDVNAINKNINYPIRDFVLRGGKRLRPILFLTCLKIFGKDPKNYMDFAAFIELIHNGTLVLDDIEDRGLLRRGKPTCHIKFGLDTATNVGISLHVLPLKILLKRHTELDEFQLIRVWQVYADELINVSFGQGLDIYWHKNKSVEKISVQRYLEMVRLKTGSLMRMSTRLACILAGMDTKTEEVLEKFGEDLGIAFQIIDDALDLAPPDEKFGKSIGNDITEGKLSLPAIFAIKNSEEGKRNRLTEILSLHTKNRQLIKEATEIIKDSGAIDNSLKFANKLVDTAWEKLENTFGAKINLDALQELTYFFIKRDY